MAGCEFIRLRSHDEIVLMQAFDLMRPPSEVLVARNHKNLVHRLLINLVMDGNQKILLLSPVG